jgi:hypothetical protein
MVNLSSTNKASKTRFGSLHCRNTDDPKVPHHPLLATHAAKVMNHTTTTMSLAGEPGARSTFQGRHPDFVARTQSCKHHYN